MSETNDRVPTPKASNGAAAASAAAAPPNAAAQPQTRQRPAHTAPRPAATAGGMSKNKKKHEEFKNQLVHDVFGRDNKGRVPMEKVAMLIWQFRDDPAVVHFMAQFVAKVRRKWFYARFCLSAGE